MWASSAATSFSTAARSGCLQRGEEVRQGDLLHLELLLEHRAAAEPALDLLGAHVLVLAHVLRADPLAPTDEGEHRAREHQDAGEHAAPGS